MHKCEECGREFAKERGLHCHMALKHGKRNPTHIQKTCAVCGAEYACKRVHAERSKYCSPECRHEGQRNGEHRICPTCGEDFYTQPSQDFGYCSPACAGVARRGEANSNWGGGKVEVRCAHCGKSAMRHPSHVHDTRGVFCDATCHGAWISEHLSGDDNPNWDGGKTAYACEICGGEVLRYPTQIKHHVFCSRKCRYVWQSRTVRGPNHWNFKGDAAIHNARDRWYKRDGGAQWCSSVYAASGHACARCGHGNRPLHAHHHWAFVDYPQWRSSAWNGICLCEDCHRLFHSNAGRAERIALAWSALRAHFSEAMADLPLALPPAA